MSNWKHAYGWVGHILVLEGEADHRDIAQHNVIEVPQATFDRIKADHDEMRLDQRIQVEQLGVIESDFVLLATGCKFSEGFKFFGTVFDAAENQHTPDSIDYEENYIAAMKEVYGLDIPPCRPMVGCSSEG